MSRLVVNRVRRQGRVPVLLYVALVRHAVVHLPRTLADRRNEVKIGQERLVEILVGLLQVPCGVDRHLKYLLLGNLL